MYTIEYKLKDISYQYPMIDPKKKIKEPKDIFIAFKEIIGNLVKEHMFAIWLNTDKRINGFEIISIGDLKSCIVTPREVFRSAIINNCDSIILAHNHPSGNLEPSREDILITQKLVECGKIIGIGIIDHIIFSLDGYYALSEKHNLF